MILIIGFKAIPFTDGDHIYSVIYPADDPRSVVQIRGNAALQNMVHPSDVDRNGEVRASDALAIINFLGSSQQSGELLSQLGQFDGYFYDQSGDGYVTALDALRVINELFRNSVAEGDL